jgi:hypothetical protein
VYGESHRESESLRLRHHKILQLIFTFVLQIKCPGGEMVDTLALGASAFGCEGSSPSLGTNIQYNNVQSIMAKERIIGTEITAVTEFYESVVGNPDLTPEQEIGYILLALSLINKIDRLNQSLINTEAKIETQGLPLFSRKVVHLEFVSSL